MDNVDGLKPTGASAMPDNDADAPEDMHDGPNLSKENGSKTETEMKGEKRNSFEISLEGVGALVRMSLGEATPAGFWGDDGDF